MIQEGNIWLNSVAEHLHLEDRRHAYQALLAALHALRDRLTPEQAVHLSAQFPVLIRGLFFGGWKLAGKPLRDRSIEDFCSHIEKELPPNFPRDAKSIAKGVFEVLFEQLDPGEVAKIIDEMPVPLRQLWPQIARVS